MNVDQVYQTVKEVFNDLDAIYEDYLIYLVGFEGYYSLLENRLLESCGVVNGRKLYALCDKKG
jgi:hypothetical protein